MTFDFHAQRPDRRQALAAGLLLLVVMAGHTVLETARDSLFLSRLPAERLPLVYAAIALASLIAAELNGRARARAGRPLLLGTLIGGAVGSALFFELFRRDVSWAPYGLYLWVAVLATLALAQFWLVVSELFTVLEAKQLYALISAGGMLGAMLGGALARVVALQLDDKWLLPLAAALFLLAAGVRVIALARPEPQPERAPTAAAGAPARPMRDLRSERYLQRLLALTLLATFAATLIDYLFKVEVARSLPPAQLGGFFGAFNAGLSGLALLVQLLVAPRVLRNAGIGRSLWLLPAALMLGACGVLLVPGLWAVLALRGGDASLRYSLYRSGVEVLYLPLSSSTRARWRVIVDVLGQRGGQALAAGAILACIALELSISSVALVVLAVAAGWLLLSMTMERHYIALFRARLKAGALETRPEVPALDMRSLESLVASLGSDDDDEVLATIDLLVEYGRGHVIPALLLYHPSAAVVVRALEVFASSGRNDFDGAARRLFEREDDEIRAAAMLAIAGRMSPPELRAELDKPLPSAARAAVLVALLGRELDPDGDYAREVAQGCDQNADPRLRLEFARAFRLYGGACSAAYLPRLLRAATPEIELEVARVMLAHPRADYVPALLQLLESRHARSVAREALVAIGEPALVALTGALNDESLPRSLRAHLPRSISRFGSEQAADAILDRIERERDGWVRFKLIRGLAQLEPHTRSSSRTRRVLALSRANLVQAVHFMALRLANEHDQRSDPRLATPGGELLTSALRDKEAHAIDRAVRLLGLLHGRDVAHNIRQALASRDPRMRADGIELLLHRVPPELAPALTALLERGHDEQRAARAAEALHERIEPENYRARVEHMLTDESEAVRAVAGYHLRELGPRGTSAPPQPREQPEPQSDLFASLRAGSTLPEPEPAS